MGQTSKYDEEFKKSLVMLHSNGRSLADLCREYGVSDSALSRWVRNYATVKTDDGEVITAKQIKELQKRNAALEEENLILKKRLLYSCPTRKTTRGGAQTQTRVRHKGPVQGPSCGQIHILQALQRKGVAKDGREQNHNGVHAQALRLALQEDGGVGVR